MGETLADLGEWELIRRLGAFAPPGQFADDAALLNLAGDSREQLVVNTDVLVEGVHFSDATTSGIDVGWRAAAANLSDLAAMGCIEARGITVGLVAPGTTPWSWVEAVYTGLRACVESHGGVVLGGDCSRGRERILAITALGNLSGSSSGEPWPIRRQDGRPGDLLVSSGAHGLSALGLALLQAGGEVDGQQLPQALVSRALARHRRPSPRFDAVELLLQSRPATNRWRVGGTDSSDGLAAAAASIARTSGCRALLDPSRLPLDPEMAGLKQAQQWCLSGGEDFELVLALDPGWAEALVALLPGSGVIGRLEQGSGGEAPLGWLGGEQTFPTALEGFQHFG